MRRVVRVQQKPKRQSITLNKMQERQAGEMAQWCCCSRSRLGFTSWHPHGGTQPFVIPVPGDLTSYYDLRGEQAHMWHPYMHAGKHLYTHNEGERCKDRGSQDSFISSTPRTGGSGHPGELRMPGNWTGFHILR